MQITLQIAQQGPEGLDLGTKKQDVEIWKMSKSVKTWF